MTDTSFNEHLYYGQVGHLYPYDIHFDPHDRKYLARLDNGDLCFNLHCEPGFGEALLIIDDGQPRAVAMRPWLATGRHQVWQVQITPRAAALHFSFALKDRRGRPVYFAWQGVAHAVETPFQLRLDDLPPYTIPDWMNGAVVYQIFPERFANGDRELSPEDVADWGAPPRWAHFQGGDLRGITQNLDYLADLGIDVLYLNPIFASPSNHKYDTEDFYHVDPAFGGNEALRELVDAVHSRDMRIILDASFNHCHPRFFAFADLVRNGAASPYRDWFTVHEFPLKVVYRPHQLHTLNPGHAKWLKLNMADFSDVSGIPVEIASDDGPVLTPTYHAWYNVLTMPKLNQNNPETRAYFLDVTAYWLREFDIDGWRMDVVTHVARDFWLDFHRVARATKPSVFLLAELWGDAGPWLQGDRFDATMNYTFRDLCIDYFALAEATTARFLDGVQGMLAQYAPPVTAVSHNLFSSHDVPRFLHVAGDRPERLRLATLFQLTMPGAPGIYYGDEVGVTGADDPDNRRAFPWHEPAAWDQETLALTRAIANLRRQYPALRYGDWQPVWHDAGAFAFQRRHEGETIVVLINRDTARDCIELPLMPAAADRLWGQADVRLAGSLQLHHVPAWSGVIIKL